MVRTDGQASLQEEGREVSRDVEGVLKKRFLVFSGSVGHVGDRQSGCAGRRLKDRHHQCPSRRACGIRIIAGKIDKGPCRQCDIVLSRWAWEQVSCSCVGEEEEKN